MPITLDVSQADIDSKSIAPGARIALRDPRDEEALAIITGMSEQRQGLHLADLFQLRMCTALTKYKKPSRSSVLTTQHIPRSHTFAAE